MSDDDYLLTVLVPGKPVPYTRMTQRSKFGQRAQRYFAYRDAVRWAARQAGASPDKPLEGPLVLDVLVQLQAKTRRSWDLDNVVKGISDALNGIAYLDDAQITELRAKVVTGPRDGVVLSVGRAG